MIYVDQALHGYANGHQMLESSCEWTLNNRKKIDVLSDLNGQCDKEKFKEYYTGYPLADESKYVIAKTWYAWEMERPGCVWTHSIIIPLTDIAHISSVDELMVLFTRPNLNEYDFFNQSLQLKEGNFEIDTQFNEEIIKYYIYTIFGFQTPRLICLEDSNEEDIRILLTCMRCMPVELLKDFSFCTLTYEIRTYGSSFFPYQMTTKELAYEIRRRNPEMEICPSFKEVEKYPFWVNSFYQYMCENRIGEIREYIFLYGSNYCNWENYNGFFRLYFMLMISEDLKLMNYFESLSVVFETEKDKLIQKTVDLILDDQFFVYEFVDVVYQIWEILGMKKFKIKIKKANKKTLVQKYLDGSPERLYLLFNQYKERRLNVDQRKIVEAIVAELNPSNLRAVSKMDEDLCVVLIRMNQKLLLSDDIWKLNRDSQIMMLYASGEFTDSRYISDIIQKIVFLSEENIVNECFEIFGSALFDVLLDILKVNITDSEQKLVKWIPVLMKRPEVVLGTLGDIPSNLVCKSIFLSLDKRDKELLKGIPSSVWTHFYKRVLEREEDEKERKKLSLEFLMVIFTVEYQLDLDVVEPVVRPIYKELLMDELPKNEWNSFQFLLPKVEPCYYWDKCRRMRDALGLHGYYISGINS